jgi:hypothetical protein
LNTRIAVRVLAAAALAGGVVIACGPGTEHATSGAHGGDVPTGGNGGDPGSGGGGHGGDPGGSGGSAGDPGGSGGQLTPPPHGVKHWTEADGISTWLSRVSVDRGHNVYAVNDGAIYSMAAGTETFRKTKTGGQFALGYPLLTVCGGEDGQAFVGWSAPETDAYTEPESQHKEGDVDRFLLQPDGSVKFDFHYELQNSAAKWMDDDRIAMSCKFMKSGPHEGELVVGTNHGFAVIYGDKYVDHRHVVWSKPDGTLMIGYILAVNYDEQGMIYEAGHWMLGALPSPPTDDLQQMIDYSHSVWVRNTYVVPWGSIEDPDDLDAIVGDSSQGWVLVGARTKGLALNHYGPKKDEWTVLNAPDSAINDLALDTDGKILVGTGSQGLWKLDLATMSFTQSPSIPSWAQVRSIEVDATMSPRTIWVVTDQGLYSLSGVE